MSIIAELEASETKTCLVLEQCFTQLTEAHLNASMHRQHVVISTHPDCAVCLCMSYTFDMIQLYSNMSYR